jgi:pimeloyl-ACP methyl ester carboxylesterase
VGVYSNLKPLLVVHGAVSVRWQYGIIHVYPRLVTAVEEVAAMRMFKVDAGGYRLGVTLTGSGLPPLVCVSGLGDDGQIWSSAIEATRVETTVVTYDRPGLGSSDPLPSDHVQTRTYGDFADELHRLLDGAGVPAFRVILGHSIGALIAQSYASRWPAATAGMVLVDSTDPRLYLDVADPTPTILDGDDATACARFDWQAGLDELLAAHIPPVPTVVVTSAKGRWLRASDPQLYRPYTLDEVDERWQRHQRDLTAQLQAVQVVAPRGGHYVHTDVPDLVAAAIDSVITSVRTSAPLELKVA